MSEPIHNKFLTNSGKWIATKRTFTVFVVTPSDDQWKIYHCPDCRNPIAQYKGDLVAEIPGAVSSEYPVKIQCKNAKCGRKILFKDAAEQVSMVE